MNREVHVRFWERAEAKFLRATRQLRKLPHRSVGVRFTSKSGHAWHAQVLAVAAEALARYPTTTFATSKGLGCNVDIVAWLAP